MTKLNCIAKLNWVTKGCAIFLLWAATAIALPAQTVTTLYDFAGTPGGEYPDAGLLQGADGDFYGTTYQGGANDYGTVFKITPSGQLTVLHSFDGLDGAHPEATLIQATDGYFYGTTADGGTNSAGTYLRFRLEAR